MIFLRLEDNRLVNTSQITTIECPDNHHGVLNYRVHMTNGRIITLTNEEAEKLMRTIHIVSVSTTEV